MKLSDLAAKPKLTEIHIEDADTVKEFGEALSFHIWDRQNMETFVKLATIDYKDFGAVSDIIQKLILNEDGKPIVDNDKILPTHVMVKAIQTVVEVLGKSTQGITEKTTVTSN